MPPDESSNGHLIAAHKFYTQARNQLEEVKGNGHSVNRLIELALISALIGIGRELERCNDDLDNRRLPFEPTMEDARE